jgi:hypothetical protein
VITILDLSPNHNRRQETIMGVTYFITPRNDIDPNYAGPNAEYWLKPDVFEGVLKTQWKNATTITIDSEHFALDWECEVNSKYSLRGSLFRNSCSVSVHKPDIHDLAVFAIWFRSLVHPDVPLAVYNDSDITPFDLTTHTTFSQLISFLRTH